MTAELHKNITDAIEKLEYEIFSIKEITEPIDPLQGSIVIKIRPIVADSKDDSSSFLDQLNKATA